MASPALPSGVSPGLPPITAGDRRREAAASASALAARLADIRKAGADAGGDRPPVPPRVRMAGPPRLRAPVGAVRRPRPPDEVIEALRAVPATPADFADAALDEADRRPGRAPRIDEIARAVAAHHGMTRADLISQCRSVSIVRARQIAMYLAKALTPHSLPEIGRRFGNRDHTTVLHALRRIESLMAADAEFKARVDRIASRFVTP